MNTSFVVVIAVGIVGLILQWIVLRSAKTEIRLRTQAWLDRAAGGHFRRQTREDAISELERSLALTPSVAALRRLGVMAPLFGVVLTAVSVMFNKASLAILVNVNEASDVVRIIEGLVPLLAGVTAGAFLAICNQLFLISFHRVEDRLLKEATAILEDAWFHDTNDRIENVISQIAGLGDVLSQMLQRIGEVVSVAATGGERLGHAILTASKSLEGASNSFTEAIAGPSREFQSAAEQIAKTAKTGLVQYRKIAEAYGQFQESGFNQLADVQRQQLEALRAEASALEQLQSLVRSAEQIRLPDWGSNFEAAAGAADSLTRSMSGFIDNLGIRTEALQETFSRSTDSIRAMMTRLESSLAAFDARCRQTGDAMSAASLRPEEINRVREGLREFTEVLATALRTVQASTASAAMPVRNSTFPWFRSGASQ